MPLTQWRKLNVLRPKQHFPRRGGAPQWVQIRAKSLKWLRTGNGSFKIDNQWTNNLIEKRWRNTIVLNNFVVQMKLVCKRRLGQQCTGQEEPPTLDNGVPCFFRNNWGVPLQCIAHTKMVPVLNHFQTALVDGQDKIIHISHEIIRPNTSSCLPANPPSVQLSKPCARTTVVAKQMETEPPQKDEEGSYSAVPAPKPPWDLIETLADAGKRSKRSWSPTWLKLVWLANCGADACGQSLPWKRPKAQRPCEKSHGLCTVTRKKLSSSPAPWFARIIGRVSAQLAQYADTLVLAALRTQSTQS